MTDSKAKAVPAEAENILDDEALAEVQGGALSLPSFKVDVTRLRERLQIGGLQGNFSNYHIKDSGPTWVNSPHSFDRGEILTLPVLNRF